MINHQRMPHPKWGFERCSMAVLAGADTHDVRCTALWLG
jgi:hypothetical protein